MCTIPKDRGSVRPRRSPDQLPQPTALSFQKQTQSKRRSLPSLRPRGTRIMSVPPAIRAQNSKMYTAVLLPPAGKLQRQAIMAEDACSAHTGRLFITDRVRKLRFLIDTGSDVCVVARRHAPGRRECMSYDIFAAKVHQYQPTGGTHSRITGRFVMADVQIPINEVDFLTNFSLLVDSPNNRLLDGVTSLSTSAQAASTRFPTIKTIEIGTPEDKFFAEFPHLTRLSGVQREVRNNTVDNIKTTPGPPVSCRPRRLTPDLSRQAAAQCGLTRLQPQPTSPCNRLHNTDSLACSLDGSPHIAGQETDQEVHTRLQRHRISMPLRTNGSPGRTHSTAASPDRQLPRTDSFACSSSGQPTSSPNQCPCTQKPVDGHQRHIALEHLAPCRTDHSLKRQT
jgi:hypothetical protein